MRESAAGDSKRQSLAEFVRESTTTNGQIIAEEDGNRERLADDKGETGERDRDHLGLYMQADCRDDQACAQLVSEDSPLHLTRWPADLHKRRTKTASKKTASPKTTASQWSAFSGSGAKLTSTHTRKLKHSENATERRGR